MNALQAPKLEVPAAAVQSRENAERIASQFEALFMKQAVSQMRESADLLGGQSMFGSGPGSDTYAAWFDNYMSEHLASSGRVGVADALMRRFEELGQVAAPQLANEVA